MERTLLCFCVASLKLCRFCIWTWLEKHVIFGNLFRRCAKRFRFGTLWIKESKNEGGAIGFPSLRRTPGIINFFILKTIVP